MTAPDVITQPQLASLELDESQPVIYDRPIGLRLLYQDPVSGAEHYLIRYPPRLQTRRHRHTAAHTIRPHHPRARSVMPRSPGRPLKNTRLRRWLGRSSLRRTTAVTSQSSLPRRLASGPF